MLEFQFAPLPLLSSLALSALQSKMVSHSGASFTSLSWNTVR